MSVVAIPIDEDQALGFTDGERVQNDLIDQRVDRGRGADPEGKREQRGGDEAGAAEERAGRVAEVVEEIAQPAGQAKRRGLLRGFGRGRVRRRRGGGLLIR